VGGASRSCIIDGKAVACDDNGVASFDLVRHQRAKGSVFFYAFDLIELNGDDLRRDPLEVRKATLRSMLAKASLGLRFNEHASLRFSVFWFIGHEQPIRHPLLEMLDHRRLGSRD